MKTEKIQTKIDSKTFTLFYLTKRKELPFVQSCFKTILTTPEFSQIKPLNFLFKGAPQTFSGHFFDKIIKSKLSSNINEKKKIEKSYT
jgi:hypothetical protein